MAHESFDPASKEPDSPSEQLVVTTQPQEIAVADTALVPAAQVRRSQLLRKWLVILSVLLLLGLVIGFLIWRSRTQPAVTLVQPKLATISETIASSGRVGGDIETLVGAQAQGVVQELYVREGDRVTVGQRLAVLKNDVAEAQAAQAQRAVETARAQLTQAARGPLGSEVEAAREQVNAANAQIQQQSAAVTQAQRGVARARAQLDQLEAERDLAARKLARSRALLADGVIPQAEFDQAETDLRVAGQRVAAQQQEIQLAEANVRQARAALNSARANLRVQQAQLKTIESGARSEDVAVARQRLREAEQAVRVAREQVASAVVTAPFDGVVTEITAELGQTVATQGVLKLVSGSPEIRLDVDENNLSDLRLGQPAVISSSTFPNQTFAGRVTELGAAVDVSRGTIEVTVTPIDPPEWLRPGQTVNVNVVTARNAQRLLIPATALVRAGDRSVVFVVSDGIALEKPVITRAPTEEGVPVLAGLTADDRIIENASSVTAGGRVRVRN